MVGSLQCEVRRENGRNSVDVYERIINEYNFLIQVEACVLISLAFACLSLPINNKCYERKV